VPDLAANFAARRNQFLGKTIVYSAGVTIMSAFPSEDRYLTRDTMLLIHCRQLEKTIESSGPMRSSLPKIEAARAQIQVGNGFEDQNFRRLVQGSDVSIDEMFEKALHNWYMPAADAMKRGLVADLI
jgi:hypothetical protein